MVNKGKALGAARSGIYALAGQFFSLAFGIGAMAILGRLLTPQEYGLFALVLVVHVMLVPILDLGLTQAYIKHEDSEQVRDAFFTLNLLFGIGVSLLLCFAAPILMTVYNFEILLPMTIVFALSVLLGSLGQQPKAVLIREKRFDHIMLVNISSSLGGVMVAVGAAITGLGAWALVLKSLSESTLRTIIATWLVGRIHCFVSFFVLKKYADSIRFGSAISVARVLFGMQRSVDKLLVGKFFPVEELGFYAKAMDLATIPDANVRMALASPVLAHVAKHKKSIRSTSYRLAAWTILVLAGTPCVVLLVIGDWLMPWLMGHQWEEAGTFAQALGVWGLGKVMHGIVEIIHLNEMWSRRWILHNTLALPIVLGPPLFALFISDLYSFVVLFATMNFLYWGSILLLTLRNCSDSWWPALKVMWCTLVLVGGGSTAGFFFKYTTAADFIGSTMVVLAATVAVCCTSLIAVFLFDHQQWAEVWARIRPNSGITLSNGKNISK